MCSPCVAYVEPAAITPPWLTANEDGSLTFWAPAEGATTENSDHPRTELNSLTNFTAGRGTHTLTASVTLLQVPKDGQGIILGQIHGAGDISSVPYVMLRYQDGGIKAELIKMGPDQLQAKAVQRPNVRRLKQRQLLSRMRMGCGCLWRQKTDNLRFA